jgi:hypothetical protein
MVPGREAIPPVSGRETFTFAVFGDNQIYEFDPGDRFRSVVAAVAESRPRFAVSVGDGIYSETTDRSVLLRKWEAYREAVSRLGCPLVQTLGNHDAFDPVSSALWRELWGPTRFHWDAGCARFVALDCETQEARVDPDQLGWLEGLLAGAGDRHVFVFVHRPLFPVVGHIGDSLDQNPADRDRLHDLLVRYRDRVRGVFHGHEHVYCHADLDGVDYYHCAGSGSKLYASPQQGGFYHFLSVTVSPAGARVEVRKVGTPPEPVAPPRAVVPGAVLEEWRSGLTWLTWDSSVAIHPAPGGLDLVFDPGRNPGPWLGAQAFPSADLGEASAVALDVAVPAEAAAGVSASAGTPGAASAPLRVTPSIGSGGGPDHEGGSIELRPGRNTVRLPLEGASPGTRSAVKSLSWTFHCGPAAPPGPVHLILAALRLEGPDGATARVIEGWESGFLWHAWNSEVSAGRAGDGIFVEFDAATCRQPRVHATAFPPLDLGGVDALEVEAEVPAGAVLSISLAIEGDRRRRSPWISLAPGRTAVQIPLDESWLPAPARRMVPGLEWTFRAAGNRFAGRVILRRMRASKAS